MNKNILLVLIIIFSGLFNAAYFGMDKIGFLDSLAHRSDIIYEFINIDRDKDVKKYKKEIMDHFPVFHKDKFENLYINNNHNDKPFIKDDPNSEIYIPEVIYGLRTEGCCFLILNNYNINYVLFWKKKGGQFMPDYKFNDYINPIKKFNIISFENRLFYEIVCSNSAFGLYYEQYYIYEIDDQNNLNLLFEEVKDEAKCKLSLEKNKLVLRTKIYKREKTVRVLCSTYMFKDNKFVKLKE